MIAERVVIQSSKPNIKYEERIRIRSLPNIADKDRFGKAIRGYEKEVS